LNQGHLPGTPHGRRTQLPLRAAVDAYATPKVPLRAGGRSLSTAAKIEVLWANFAFPRGNSIKYGFW